MSQIIGAVKVNIINPLILLLFALALVYFLYGVFEFMKGLESVETRGKGQQHMIWGLIGMFIMISVFGIINLIISFLK